MTPTPPLIVTPKLGIQFGYRATTFDKGEFATMDHPRLHPFALLSSASYWPWLFVELKSSPRGGIIRVSEYQNAAIGILLRQLFGETFSNTHRSLAKLLIRLHFRVLPIPVTEPCGCIGSLRSRSLFLQKLIIILSKDKGIFARREQPSLNGISK